MVQVKRASAPRFRMIRPLEPVTCRSRRIRRGKRSGKNGRVVDKGKFSPPSSRHHPNSCKLLDSIIGKFPVPRHTCDMLFLSTRPLPSDLTHWAQMLGEEPRNPYILKGKRIMIDSNPTFDTIRLCDAVIDDGATVASLLDRVHDGETAGHYCLTDRDGRIRGIVAVQDVLEFLVPYMLFTDADALEGLLATVGTIPLKILAGESYPAVFLHQDLSNIMQRLDGSQELAEEVTCTRLLKRLPRQGRENQYAVS